MVDTSMILSLSIPEITEIKRRILQDRKYDVPAFFYSYIDDDFIIDTIVFDERTENRDAFIKDYQKNSGFHSYKNLIITLLEHDLLEDLHLFDPVMITKYCKRLIHIFRESDVVSIMLGWLKHEGVIPFNIVYLYILKTCGKVWFLSVDRSMTILQNKLYEFKCYEGSDDILVELLYQMYSNISYLNKGIYSISDQLGYGLVNYYEMGGSKFIHVNKQTFNDNDVVSTISYLTHARKIEKLPDDLPDRNRKILCRYPHYTASYREAVRNSLVKNANNLHLVTWGMNLKSNELQTITDTILSSEVPLEDFQVYVHLYNVASSHMTVHISLTRDLLLQFIKSGTDVNTMIDYIDIRECWYDIIRYGSNDSLRELVRNTDPYTGSTSGETIGIFLLNGVDWVDNPVLLAKMIPIVCEDTEIFDELDTDIKDFITRSIKIDWLISSFPNLLLSDYFKTFVNNATLDMRKLCATIPSSLSYLPAKYINLSTIQYVAKTRGYIKLPYVRLTTENVLKLIDDDCGYGYILDLPTYIQMNTLVISVLNRIYEN